MKRTGSAEKLEELLVGFTENLTEGASRSMELDSTGQIDSLPEEAKGEALSLFETVRTISSVIQPKQPSEEFMARVSNAVQEKFQEQIQGLPKQLALDVKMQHYEKNVASYQIRSIVKGQVLQQKIMKMVTPASLGAKELVLEKVGLGTIAIAVTE